MRTQISIYTIVSFCKKAILLIGVATLSVSAQDLKPSSKESKISFTIKNLGINTTGYFREINGNIEFSPENPGASKFEIDIPTKSLDTDNNLRDKHLKGDQYFSIDKYPSIHFSSTKVSANGQGILQMEGNLSIKGVNKAIRFEFKSVRQGNGFLFSGSVPLNRRDFKVGGKSMTMSDDLTVNLSVVATK